MIELPPIISERDFPSEAELLEEARRIFIHDFIDYPPTLNKSIVKTRLDKMPNGYYKTFWHIVTEGNHREEDRIEKDRLVRLPWINPAIEGQPDNEWFLWKEARSNARRPRIHIYFSKMRYLIVIELDARTGQNVFWTAYPISEDHEDRKLIKRYKQFFQDGRGC